jgi:hypothetical protein
VLARMAAEEELGRLSPNKPASNRDIAHYAATLRGYTGWGIPGAGDDYGFGDLGGWPLDLLQVWGSFYRARQANPSLNQDQFLSARVGVRDADGGFDWSDVVADCDAYLIARSMKDNHLSMSDAARGLLKLTDSARVAKFYADRFGRSEANVVAAFGKLADGIDVGGVNFPITNGLLLQAADADELPNADEARICGQVFARMMGAQG